MPFVTNYVPVVQSARHSLNLFDSIEAMKKNGQRAMSVQKRRKAKDPNPIQRKNC